MKNLIKGIQRLNLFYDISYDMQCYLWKLLIIIGLQSLMKRKQSEQNQPDKNDGETLIKDLLKPLKDFSSTEKQASEMLNSQLLIVIYRPFIISEYISTPIHGEYGWKWNQS